MSNIITNIIDQNNFPLKNVPDPEEGKDAANKDYVDNASSGDGNNLSFANILSLSNDADGLQIANLGNPQDDMDASTKQYVDNQISESLDTINATVGNAIDTAIGGLKDYAGKYKAQISQSGTDNPEVSVVSNTFSELIVWTLTGQGVVTGVLEGIFSGITDIRVNNSLTGMSLRQMHGVVQDENTILLVSYDPVAGDTADDWSTFIEITVYAL